MNATYSIRRATPADAPAVARVHVDSWRTTYRGIVPDAFLDSLSYAESERRWRSGFEQPSPGYAMFVAEGPDGIVGFATGGRLRHAVLNYDGELYAIYIAAAHHRSGLGRRLVHRVAEHLTASGFHSMIIWALADNHPARRFYEALGGQLVSEADTDIGGKRLREVAYGWSDLAAWLHRAPQAGGSRG
ncbi:MAG: GNAT family N-acetyltransferase [Thermoflavifilum sp.]|nr:GNAT family N-acetyltransferase [Thermoflavifilum sp.]MCL6513805.1 GNAT family N-acetyltransferase [Alicyclobacillus sp.]